MFSSRFRLLKLGTHWWLTPLHVVGFLIGSFPQFGNGLECYTCIHATSQPGLNISEFAPDKVNPDCLDPILGKVNMTTCIDPNASCMKGFGVGNFIFEVQVLIRQCFLPKSGQMMADSCTDFNGTAFSTNFTIDWGEKSLLPTMWTETWEVITQGARARALDEGKKFVIPDVDVPVTGTYCLCNTKNLCNDAPGMGVVDPIASTTIAFSSTAVTGTDKGSIRKPEPQVIFFIWICVSASSTFLNTDMRFRS